MKSPYVGTLVPNENVTGLFLVLSKEIRQKKSGEPYLSLHLADRTGDIEAKMWDNVEEVMNSFDRDDFVKVKGLVQLYQNRSQFVIHKIRRMDDHEVEFDDFFPCSERNPDEMVQELRGIIDGIQNQHLRELLQLVVADDNIMSRYRVAPAAKTIHHACRGGLLEHVLSLCKLCRLVAPQYPSVDLDTLLTGAILHDVGKIDELSYGRSFGYSSEGQLLGHIIIGLRMTDEKIAQLPSFPPRLRTLIEHMIISHHGELAYGSPKVPLFEEAMLLHQLDNLDSKMETMKNAVRRDHNSDGEFTGWVNALERPVLRKSRYLQGSSVETKPQVANMHQPPSEQTTFEPVTVPPKPSEHKAFEKQKNTVFGEKLQAVLGSEK